MKREPHYVLVSTPTTEDSYATRVFCGLDFATESDRPVFAFVQPDGRIDWWLEEPTGHITVDGEPMAFWLPDGVTAEALGLNLHNSEG